MAVALRNILHTTVPKCVGRKVLHPSIMLKRSLQNPPKKKLKPNQGMVNSSKNMSASPECNLDSNLTNVDIMQLGDDREKSDGQDDKVQDKKPRIKVEYLEPPIKSENDKKEYRVIKLENGLTALLIADTHSLAAACQDEDDDDNDKVDAIPSGNEIEDDEESDDDEDDDDDEEDDDEETDEERDSAGDDCERTESNMDSSLSKKLKREEKMAACGLCVGVGSFSDPPEIPGMAHFLEHMVFMGSERYPQENDFDAFIKKRGGSDNASTECEQTTFYFEVQEKYLLAGLDRFAQFFINPLMKRDAITREREAVESEFQMALPSDLYRKEQLFCSFARPHHPATKFTWGNLVTLRDNVTDEKLYEELHKFRERHYSAHRMKLAIQARLPLDTLEEYVIECFANVPNNGLPPDDFTAFKGADSFNTSHFRKMYKIRPIKDVCQIELTWAMPPLHDLYKSKPHQYVSWIIGHEGKGSLISYLRKQMWCLDIFSGNGESGFEHSSMYALFSLSLILTDEGHKHLQDVLNAIFSFINLMRKEGPQKRIYDEIHQIEETNFRFTDEVPPAEYVEELCENMHFYPPRDYITGSDLYFEYNPVAIQACMNSLSPDNVNLIIFDKKFNDEEFEKVEPWFKTKYTDMDIPAEWIECWRTIPALPDFHLPLPNIFLADDFSLISVPADVPKYPTKIHEDRISEIWYRPDPKFGLPECYMYFYLVSPMAVASPTDAAMMDLFIGILKQLLVEELYPATAAELNHRIYTGEKGIMMTVNGFNQRLPLLLTTIAKCIADSPNLVTKDLFEVMKKEQIKAYYNSFLKPRKLVKDVRLSILMLVYWTAVDKHSAITGVDFYQFQNFVKHFTDHIYIQCLVQGNMTERDVIKNVQNCVEILKCGPLLPNTMPQFRIVEIPVGTHYCKVRNFNKTDVNSVVTNYYQSGLASIKLTVIIDLLIMIMEEPLFNQLRTLEQLGYNVFCLTRSTYGILGYSISVYTQADKYTTDHVDERIESFLGSFNKILKETSEKELDSVKDALIKLKQCADIHLKEEVNRNWAEITNGTYMFDHVERELVAIEDIGINELRDWMKSHTLEGSNLKKLSVQVIGTVPKDKDKDTEKEKDKDKDKAKDKKKKKNSSASDMEIGNDIKMESSRATVKYPLEYVASDAERKDANYITDVQNYKRGLYIYPINTAL
ncbi:hypothetical protein KM043_001439 [Ampulex compressa]|nr:hypothetical protein KM043_001439 [Ampulex compressa]